MSPHLQSRTKVGEILLASGIETVVLQAGVIIGSGSASFEMIRHLTDRLPVMTTPKWVHNKIQPIAWWVGLVKPIPSRLARPLVESLHCDAVMDNHEIDAVIPPPSGGPIGYRDSVTLALKPIADGAAGNTPSESSPSDPDWAGAIAYTLKRSGWTAATEEELWKHVENAAAQRHWQVKAREPGRQMLLHNNGAVPGDAWLQMRVGSVSGRGSTYHQRMTFYPKGIPGRMYWYAGLRGQRKRFREVFRGVLDGAGR